MEFERQKVDGMCNLKLQSSGGFFVRICLQFFPNIAMNIL